MSGKIHDGLGRSEYERIEAANYSTLKHFDRSPAHARQEMLHPGDPTEAMELGSALHLAVLEPERFAAEYVKAPKVDKRTKEGKAFWADFQAQHPGRDYLAPDDFDRITGMQDAIAKHNTAAQLLGSPGKTELSMTWTDPETGEACRGRVDAVKQWMGWTFILDLKSTADASTFAFARQCASLYYHAQAAFYLDGLAARAPADRRFVHIAVEKEPPYAVNVVELDDQAIQIGRNLYRRWLKSYATCRKENKWPAYADGIVPLTLPPWANKGGGE